MSSDGRRLEASEDSLLNRTLTWHEHVYRKLSGRPTPHYIENILGLQEEKKAAEPQEPLPTICSTVPDMNEPLNLSVKSDLKVRSKTIKGGCFHWKVNTILEVHRTQHLSLITETQSS